MKDDEPRPTRAAWSADEIPSALTREARRQLIEINKGYDVEGRLDDLERELVQAVVEPRRLDVSAKLRRRDLAELASLATELRSKIMALDARSRQDLAQMLAAMNWDRNFHLARSLSTYRHACHFVRDAIPSGGGKPRQARRDNVIRIVVAWLATLQKTRAHAAVHAALTRDAVRDPLHVALTAPRDDLQSRLVQSVKAVCAALGLSLGREPARNIAKTLSRKPV